MKLVDQSGKPIRSDSNTLDTLPIEGTNSDRLKPRQTGTGAMRGQQTLLGDKNSKIVFGIVPDTTNDLGITFYDDIGTRRFLVGDYPNDAVKMKLSQVGYDVRTATDDQLIWSSDFNNFKIVTAGSLTVNYVASSYQATASYTHGLGRTPAFVAFVSDTAAYYGTPYISFAVAGTESGKVRSVYDVIADSTTITARVTMSDVAGGGFASNATVIFKYYLLQETAN